MSKPKFTPGPWELYHQSHGRNRWTIAVFKATTEKQIVGWTGFDSSDFLKQALANARLIAAAPELYEALVMLMDAAQDVAFDDTADGKGYNAARDLADAALAKVEGK